MTTVVHHDTEAAQRAIDSLWARAETIVAAGRGQVETSARKKKAGETRKQPHGALIWNVLRARGYDPGRYDEEELNEVMDFIATETEEILAECGRTHRPQIDRIRRLLRAAAEELSAWVRENIESGGLGQNTGKYLRKKTRLTYSGFFSDEHGNPGPRGYATGRFLAGIRGRWVQGGRRKHAIRPRVSRGHSG